MCAPNCRLFRFKLRSSFCFCTYHLSNLYVFSAYPKSYTRVRLNVNPFHMVNSGITEWYFHMVNSELYRLPDT